MKTDKEQLKKPDILYFVSMGMLAIGFLAALSTAKKGTYDVNGTTVTGNFWYYVIAAYAASLFACYMIRFVKNRNYNASSEIIPDYKYKINHFYGVYNFFTVFPLDVGLLLMILGNGEQYAELSDVIAYFAIGLFFTVSFILRKTKLKCPEEIGLLCFDANSALYFLYAGLLCLINYIGVTDTRLWFFILIGVNFIITNITAYYPAKAVVYAFDKEEANPVKTIYSFVKKLMHFHVFFFVGLVFTLIIGAFYYLFSKQSTDDSTQAFLYISYFYFGMALVRFFSWRWDRKIRNGGATEEEKFKSKSKILLFNAAACAVFSFLVIAFLSFIYTSNTENPGSIGFLVVQFVFANIRIVFTIMDFIKASRAGDPYDIGCASIDLLSFSTMVYSVIVSVCMYVKADSSRTVGLVSGLATLSLFLICALYLLIRAVLGIRGKLKVKNDD